MTKEQQHADATAEVLSVVTQFLRDDTKEFEEFTDDLVREAICNATEAARHARELVEQKALGLELAPLGYYLKDEELGEHTDIDRLPDGGIWITPI